MLKEYYQKQKEKQIQEIIEIANQEENNYLLLREKLNAYYFYCYKHHLECNNEIFDKNRIQNKSYIIESEPDLLDVDTEKVESVIAHLKEAIENNKNGLVDGISLEEAATLLEYNIEQVRKNIIYDIEKVNDRNDKNVIPEDIKTSNLGGLCGFVQFLSLFPLQKLGLEITINNVYNFPEGNKGVNHAFGTVKIPIKEGNNVYLNRI